jgi:hypothetical protein
MYKITPATEMNCFNMSDTFNNLYNLTLTQSFDYDFIFQMRYEIMIMSINLILMSILIKVSGIKSSMGIKNVSYQEENTQVQPPQEPVQPSQEPVQPPQDELTRSIIKLLSDKKRRKAKQIIYELNLNCNKQYLNQSYLYPMKEKGLLDSDEWFWKLS